MKILLIEDDEQIGQYILKGFTESGATVNWSKDGRDGLFMATTEMHDVVILDRMLPHLDGLTLLKGIRGAEVNAPVLILSALGAVDDRVDGLQAGADDYLTKPFAFSELQARIEALVRREKRGGSEEASSFSIADLKIDFLARTVKRASARGERRIELSPREFALLKYMADHVSQVVTRTMLLEHVWDYHFDPQTNVVDVHISRLRQKVDSTDGPRLIHTVRGVGYVFGLRDQQDE